ncbi:ADP-ribosylation_factor [Hexamita inflata]|uniref:ADP-ribosylation factor n=1 Tax=Hexamita inflata TaxID=28002 RepID=A0AA86R0T3_9EUKA|nr:ADP-ribosylation factor [Hexamita inflata]CAI9967538.1 ADP-ribosylation factor [Hexamita inflata]
MSLCQKPKMKELCVLMLGLDKSGKTALLYKWLTKKSQETIPTTGFNVEIIKSKNISLTITDVNGQDQTRLIWSTYTQNIQLLFFVIDSSQRDVQIILSTHSELQKLINNLNVNIPFIILFNKSDLPNIFSDEEIWNEFDLKIGENNLNGRRIIALRTSAKIQSSFKDVIQWVQKLNV